MQLCKHYATVQKKGAASVLLLSLSVSEGSGAEHQMKNAQILQ